MAVVLVYKRVQVNEIGFEDVQPAAQPVYLMLEFAISNSLIFAVPSFTMGSTVMQCHGLSWEPCPRFP